MSDLKRPKNYKEAKIIGVDNPMPSPTVVEEDSPLFEAIWQCIKSWDVNVPEYYEGYCGATGSHVTLILRAIEGGAG